MSGTTHKTTAVALQNRRLAKVSRRRGVWRAEPTDAGRYFVQHGACPAGHWSASSTPASRPATPAGRSRPKREPRVTGLRPVDQLMADLAEAGGELSVTAAEGGYWENLAAAATRHGKVPAGKILRVAGGRDWSERIIRLVAPPTWITVELQQIPLAESLRGPHPVVKALRDDQDRLPMSRPVRARALRILDAIAKAAVGRGYTVTASKADSGYRHPRGHLVVTIGRHPNTLIVDELIDRVPHEPTRQELQRNQRYSWATIASHDRVPSGRLRINLERGRHIRQDSFSDTKTLNLEDRLPQVLQELELRAAAAEEHKQRREQQRQERKRQWEQVRDQAIVQAREHHRARVLADQVERWHQIQRLDAYLHAMQATIADLNPAEHEAATEWLAWARQHRKRIDPLGQPLRLPADPRFTAEVITPFMQGWSAYGPPAH